MYYPDLSDIHFLRSLWEDAVFVVNNFGLNGFFARSLCLKILLKYFPNLRIELESVNRTVCGHFVMSDIYWD